MRMALYLAGALALSVSAAQGQGRDRDREEDEGWWKDGREYRDEHGRGHDDGGGWHEGRSGRFRGGGAARFYVRSGETRLGMICDSGESMGTCIEAALTLLDGARQAGSSGTSTTGGSASPNVRPQLPKRTGPHRTRSRRFDEEC
jgi:hypothetical protein